MSILTDIGNILSNNPIVVGIKNGADTAIDILQGQNTGQTVTQGLQNLQPVAPVPTQPPVVTRGTHDIAQTVGNVPNDVSSIGGAIGSISDFLSYIAWIFYPAHILRAVEFVAGIIIGGFGLSILFRGRGGGGLTGRAISATPVGRVIRVRRGTRMGRYEGQREAARMEARQRETRSVREGSAYERERISRDARRRARS